MGFFAWEAYSVKVLILDRLKRRDWSLENRQFLCLEEEQIIDHILIHSVITIVFSLFGMLWFFSLFGVLWTLPSFVKGMFLG